MEFLDSGLVLSSSANPVWPITFSFLDVHEIAALSILFFKDNDKGTGFYSFIYPLIFIYLVALGIFDLHCSIQDL